MSRGVTEAMVEAGAKACRDITFNALTMDECRDAVRVALEAAFLAAEPGAADEFCHHGALRAACPHCRTVAALAAAPHQSGESGNNG